MKKKLLLIATGGTISSERGDKTPGYAAKRSGEELLSGLALEDHPVETIDFRKINSTYMTPRDMLELGILLRESLQRDDIAGAVVTHGTSTLEETAFLLDLLLHTRKPVVLTGSQRPASAEWPDGPSNLEAAFRVAGDPAADDQGVLVAFAERIHIGREVRKVHTTALQAFAGGEVGFVYPDRVGIKGTRHERFTLKWPIGPLPTVDIIPFYSGADGRYFGTALEAGAAGLVVEGLGMGNVNEAYYQGIIEARGAGLPVVLTTRCFSGRVVPCYGYPGGGASLKKWGVVFGGSLSSPKARILLMLALAAGYGPGELQDIFDQTSSMD
ncbi:MAG: asparaginase [Deltaproteobacteria bacterium]|nr:asparaginase [Deltaproteobacteria bacterium]